MLENAQNWPENDLKYYLSPILCSQLAKCAHIPYFTLSFWISEKCIMWFHSRSHTFGQFWIKIEQLILKAPLGFGLKVTRSNNKVGTIGDHVKNRKLLISEHLVINKRLLCDLTSLISTLFTLFRPYQTTISVFIFRPCKNDDARGNTWFLKICIRNCLIGFQAIASLWVQPGTRVKALALCTVRT